MLLFDRYLGYKVAKNGKIDRAFIFFGKSIKSCYITLQMILQNMDTNKRIGICLSGGGARGIAHIGVLQYLEEHNIHPEVVSGTSAGSIIGAMYAAGMKPLEMLEVVKKARLWRALRFRNPFRGLTDLTYLRKILLDAIETDDFAALQKKLIISVTNFNTGDVEYLDSGSLLDVVSAACSVPIAFRSVKINGNYYADGGIMDNLPVKPLIGKVDFIIGVDLIPIVPLPDKKVKYIGGAAMRTFNLSVHSNTKPNIPLCDVYIAPENLVNYGMVSIRPADALFNVGYEGAKEKLSEVLIA